MIYPAQDFTNPDVFLSYLSAFWTQVFTDREAVRGLLAGDAAQLAQLNSDFVELVRSASVDGMAALHEEGLCPVFIRASTLSVGPGKLSYGQGAVYGAQPVGGAFVAGQTLEYGQADQLAPAWYHAVDPGVGSLGGVIVNRPFDPSVVWAEGGEYALQATPAGPILVFRDDPFANPLLAQRVVDGPGGAPDREICLFALRARLDRGDVQARYGYPFFSGPPAGLDAEGYRALLRWIMRLYSGGPTIAALDAFFAAACGVPLVREPLETVEAVVARADGSQVVLTDAGVYPVAAGLSLRSTTAVGAALPAGTPLSTATAVWDARTAPEAVFAQPGLHAGADFLPPGLSAGFGFGNVEVAVDPGDPIPLTVDGVVTTRRSGSFALVGLPADLAAFWQGVAARGTADGTFFADRLWRARGAVDASGEPDYSQSVFVNPLEFLYDNFLRDGLVGVSLSVPPTAALLASLRVLRETLPATRTLLLFVTPRSSDDFALTVDPAVGTDPTASAPTDERALLAGADVADLDASNPVAHASGPGESGGLQVDTLDFGDPSVVLHTVRYETFPAC